ncbi:MAG TPA: DUF4911 domain-containing protein [Candidatus Acidoferrales bacterium]|nr:DUF4911 domain-containing protein [Candidatus Acidoferrales bacterium]
MTPPRTSIHSLYLQLAPADIALVKFLFESYESVGIVRTVDRRTAIIVVLVVEDFLPVARAIVRALQTQIACTEIDAPPIDVDDWLMREINAAS